MTKLSKLIFSICAIVVFAVVGISSASAAVVYERSGDTLPMTFNVTVDDYTDFGWASEPEFLCIEFGGDQVGGVASATLPYSNDFQVTVNTLPAQSYESVYLTGANGNPCQTNGVYSYALEEDENFLFTIPATGHTVTQSAADVGGTITTLPEEAGQSVKNGLPYVLGVAGALIVLAIIITATYLWIANHGVGGSLKTSKILGQGKRIGLSAPKGYHYTTFKKRNGESTSYLFKD